MNKNLKFKSKLTLYDFLTMLENDEIDINLYAQTSIGGKSLTTHIGLYYFKKKNGCEVLNDGLCPLVIDKVDTRKYIVESCKIVTEGISIETVKTKLSIIIKGNPTAVERVENSKILKDLGNGIQSATKKGIENVRSAFK